MYVSISFFAIYSKNLRQPIPQNLLSYAIFFWGCPYEKKLEKYSVRGGTALFGHQVQNNFFVLIKKNPFTKPS